MRELANARIPDPRNREDWTVRVGTEQGPGRPGQTNSGEIHPVCIGWISRRVGELGIQWDVKALRPPRRKGISYESNA